MILGLNHVGLCVTDMERSLRFYSEVLGFNRVLFDVTTQDSGMNQVVDRSTRTRVLLLENAIGGGSIKLVQLLPHHNGDRVHPGRSTNTLARRWGDPGYLEIAVESSDVYKTYAEFENKDLDLLIPPQHWHIPEVLDGTYFYTRDPDGTFIEVIDGAKKEDPSRLPGIYGLNHIAIGVQEMDRALDFYCGTLGFSVLIDVSGNFPGEEKVVGEKINLRIVMLGGPTWGGRLELVQILPPNRPKPKPPQNRWGGIGVMEVALEVVDIKHVNRKLSSLGLQFLSPVITLPGTAIRYQYFADPDENKLGLYEFK